MATDLLLVVEDELDLRKVLQIILSRAGFLVIEAANGREALRAFHERRPNLVVLDIALPVMDGWQTLARIREMSDCPVLMLTARNIEWDKVRALEAGADDYVAKPFGNDELVARIRALLRRAATGASPTHRKREEYDDGVLRVDFTARSVRIDGREIDLTPLEFRLLAALVRNRGNVLSPSQLLHAAWDDDTEVAPERVKLVVHRLRSKLGEAEPELIQTVRGFGYRYRPPLMTMADAEG
jgi:DNA-binding response OmpR family regulator